MINSNLFCL